MGQLNNLRLEQLVEGLPHNLNFIHTTDKNKLEDILNQEFIFNQITGKIKVERVNGLRFEYFDGNELTFFYYAEQYEEINVAINRLYNAIIVKSLPQYINLHKSHIKVVHSDGVNIFNISPDSSLVFSGDLGDMNNLNIISYCLENMYMLPDLLQRGYIMLATDIDFEEIEVLYKGEIYTSYVYFYDNLFENIISRKDNHINKHVLAVYDKKTKTYFKYDSDVFKEITHKYLLIDSFI